MKKFFLLVLVLFSLTVISANAFSIETISSHVVKINGTRIDMDTVKDVVYSKSNGTTKFYFANGNITTFNTSYNEYLQIHQACYPVNNSDAANYNTNYYGTYGQTYPRNVYYAGYDGYYYEYNYNRTPPSSNNSNTGSNTNTNTNTQPSSGNIPANAIMAPTQSQDNYGTRFERSSGAHYP